MGQYYRPIILKEDYKNENKPCIASLDPWEYGNGVKLMEHSYVGNKFVEAFAQLVHQENKKGFAGCCIVWCGDYGEPINEKDMCELSKEYTISDSYAEYRDGVEHPYKYMINLDKRQYVEIPPYDENRWNIHPLPLLTAYGNGQGGGDYFGNDMDKVGIWAFDHIYVSNEIPEGYTELKVNFVQQYLCIVIKNQSY